MRKFCNPWPHPPHRILDILRWKLGWIADEYEETSGVRQGPEWEVLEREIIAISPEYGWRVTWLGHASFLLQGAGRNLLIDPIFSRYCSPVPFPSLRRLVPTPCKLDALPAIDAVLLTHGHFDHLDLRTLRKLGLQTRLIVPQGHKGWLSRRGFRNVEEVGWWATSELCPGISVTATPAMHFSARSPWDRNRGHWGGWLIAAEGYKLWHTGDSGWCPAFEELGERAGPIDFGMIPIGAYSPRKVMQAVHMTPEEAVEAFIASRCRRAVAMHWGTFALTDEPVGEPPVRLAAACAARSITTFTTVPIGRPLELT